MDKINLNKIKLVFPIVLLMIFLFSLYLVSDFSDTYNNGEVEYIDSDINYELVVAEDSLLVSGTNLCNDGKNYLCRVSEKVDFVLIPMNFLFNSCMSCFSKEEFINLKFVLLRKGESFIVRNKVRLSGGSGFLGFLNKGLNVYLSSDSGYLYQIFEKDINFIFRESSNSGLGLDVSYAYSSFMKNNFIKEDFCMRGDKVNFYIDSDVFSNSIVVANGVCSKNNGYYIYRGEFYEMSDYLKFVFLNTLFGVKF